jgi:phosphate transport system substrate-binding protein
MGAVSASVDDDKAHERVTVTGKVSGETWAVAIEYPGSGAAFECLKTSDCDVGMASRPIQPAEADKLAKLGDMTSIAAEHVIAVDGIAVVVNRTNKVNKLTVQQIGKIFRGEINNWSQVGGANAAIDVYTRNKKSGTYDSFVALALGGKDIPDGKAKIAEDNDVLSAAVSKDEAAIGYVGLPYIKETKALAVQDGDGLPLVPTTQSVGDEDYAFSRRLFLYTPEKSADPNVGAFVDFALSDDGQKIVAATGFVSLDIQSSASAIPSDAPTTYVKDVSGATRLSFNIRFRSNGSDLDGKAASDLERLSRYVKVRDSKPRLVLVGFADKVGNETSNVTLSKQRAQAVADKLKGLGVTVDVVDGFGSTMPLAPNDSAEGRQKNRRVEVWLRET